MIKHWLNIDCLLRESTLIDIQAIFVTGVARAAVVAKVVKVARLPGGLRAGPSQTRHDLGHPSHPTLAALAAEPP